ncbi:MAG: LruC domain-containing protein [Bacteroidia bacterium]
MKKTILSALVLTSIFSSCTKDIKKDEPNTTINPNPQTMQEMVVPAGFSYKTTQDVNFTVKLLANNDQPLSSVRIDIMDDSPENNGKIIATGITNSAGILSMPYNIPNYLKQVVLNVNYIGVVNNVIVPVDANNPSVNVTIGGKNPMKVTTAENKNQAKPHNSLGKAFSRLSYKLGTFSGAGVPNYLVQPRDVVTSQFLADVNATLPEQRPVPTYNPQYLASNLERNLVLTAQCDVWITFVHEGAGNLNSLFYFKYNKNNKPTSANDIDSLIAIMPNTSYSGSGGGMTTGDKVYIGRFGADTAIGFALGQNSWSNSSVNSNATFYYTINALNPESTAAKREHVVLLYDNPTQRFLIGIEDLNRDVNSDNDFNDCVIYATANPVTNVSQVNVITTTPATGTDTDGDGVLNAYDEYPTDPARAYNVSYPSATTFATVAFEDLWPSQGDYDMNDVVVNYQYKGVLNAANKMVDMTAKYKLRAAGGTFKNAFCVELPINKSAVTTITGGLGLDAAANKAILKVFANSLAIIPSYNTIKGNTTLVTDTITMSMNFGTPQSITLSSFNPFIWVDETGKGRGHEVHLPDFAPTELATTATFGTAMDNSIPASSRYYKTKLNLPFAINIPETFAYPAEKELIILAHLKFAAWAQSGGVQYQDWYKNLSGYRNNAKLY